MLSAYNNEIRVSCINTKRMDNQKPCWHDTTISCTRQNSEISSSEIDTCQTLYLSLPPNHCDLRFLSVDPLLQFHPTFEKWQPLRFNFGFLTGFRIPAGIAIVLFNEK